MCKINYTSVLSGEFGASLNSFRDLSFQPGMNPRP